MPNPDTPPNTTTTSTTLAPMRIGKFLARAGVCSRRQAEHLILAGRVSVDGIRLNTPAMRVMPSQNIQVDHRKISLDQRVRLWKYNKKRGLLCTQSDPRRRKTIFDALPKNLASVISVGRLDMDSEGLLLLTNDGDLARQLELPSSALERHYRARVYGQVNPKKLASLASGSTYRGVRYGPVLAHLETPQTSANCWLNLVFTEGKYREARHVMQSIGVSVNRLIRLQFGPVKLGNLPPGKVEEINAAPLASLCYPGMSPAEKK